MAPLKVFLNAILTLLFFSLINRSDAIDFKSPCSRLFVYENKNDEPDKWYGIVTLLSETNLSGVWLRLIFDQPSLQLGNWFGEIGSDGNNYIIKNPQFQLKAYVPQVVRFYVKYDPSKPIPQLTSFRLNAKTLCPEGVATEAPPASTQLYISGPLETGTPVPIPSAAQASQVKPKDIAELNTVCGTVVAPAALIAYGEKTHEGEFPWHAAIYYAETLDMNYVCGGSLISRYHVITIADCVLQKQSKVPLYPEKMVVYLGKYSLRSFTNSGIQYRQVSKVIPHPEYNLETFDNDIALVKFTSPADITRFVRPICLWSEITDLTTVQGSVVGWGYDETGKFTSKLMQAKMPVVALDTCIQTFPGISSRFTSKNSYCAGFGNGTSVCNGDAGGGMAFPKPSSKPNNQVWQLRGLVSIDKSSENVLSCNVATYAVFTDIVNYLDWIWKSMSE